MSTTTMKLKLKPVNGGAFNNMPAREVDLKGDRVLCNNVVLPWEYNPHKVRLWLIGNEYGACGAVWSDCEQDALDELCDAGLAAGLAIDEADADEETARLGNAGEPPNLDHAWMQEVDLSDPKLLCLFAEARGAQYDTLNHLA